MPLSPAHQAEIANLSARFGEPRRVTVELPCTNFNPLNKKDRIGEVCMVVRRTDGRLITARKVFYPRGAYPLPTGGIMPGEPIEEALLREVFEETGLEVEVRRFLAVLTYYSRSTDPDCARPCTFHTFAFLLDEVGGVLEVQDEHEQIEEFGLLYPRELPAMADTIERVAEAVSEALNAELDGHWRKWGIFRAAAQRVVFSALENE